MPIILLRRIRIFVFLQREIEVEEKNRFYVATQCTHDVLCVLESKCSDIFLFNSISLKNAGWYPLN